MKKIIIAVTVVLVFLVALFGPFNVYHYVSAEKIVKQTSFVFEMIYEGDNWEVIEVEYLGRQTYYVKMQNEDTYIIQINGNKYHLEVDVYSGGQSYGVFLEYL